VDLVIWGPVELATFPEMPTCRSQQFRESLDGSATNQDKEVKNGDQIAPAPQNGLMQHAFNEPLHFRCRFNPRHCAQPSDFGTRQN